jgi:hypothetical protein
MTPKLNIVPAEIFAERVACNYSPNILAPGRRSRRVAARVALRLGTNLSHAGRKPIVINSL